MPCAVELKVGGFEPEYLGKMSFYLEGLDRTVKKLHENPAIGVFSTRARAHAPVATTTHWDELTNNIKDTSFTIFTYLTEWNR